VVALALVLAVVMLGAGVIAGAGQARARAVAQHGADTAALAGAREARASVALGADTSAACAAAHAMANVTRCEARGMVVTVRVTVPAPLGGAAALAVAGPSGARFSR